MTKKLLESPFERDKCFPVCDDGLPWASICANAPIAIAVGCSIRIKAQQSADLLAKMALDRIERRFEAGVGYPIIASNQAFQLYGHLFSRARASA